ncbi:MAG: alpha-hydroxy acid oxidase [Chloroflexota bacterium]
MDKHFFVNLDEVEAAAQDYLTSSTYGYYAGYASDGVTHGKNRTAFNNIELLPRYMVDVSERDLSTEMMGQPMDMPVMVAPMAMMGLAHAEAECGIARACAEAGITMCMSTMSNTSIEDIVKVGANMWFQLYVHKDRGLSQHLVDRAEAAGFRALVLTVDVPTGGYRENVMRLPVNIPESMVLANLVEYWDREKHPDLFAYVNSQFDPSLTWKDFEKFVNSTNLPVLVKGILHPEDAKLAIEHGAAGIIVSNHGGRQLDTAPATINVLPCITEAVDGRVDVMMDGGVRRGEDIIKALAYGAKAVMVGRSIAFALAIGGQAGVTTALDILRKQYDTALMLSGVTSSRDVPRSLILE